MGQELWLSERQLSQMQQLDTQFVARSGMEQAVSAGILPGRPFGGVSIAWSHDLDHVINPVSNYSHKRVVAVELQTENGKLLFISVYMPFYDARKREKCLAETIDTLSMVELLIADHPGHLVIIGGDLNTELKGNSPFDTFWRDVTTRNQLTYCSRLASAPDYTYHHASLGQRKHNDHFIVSENLLRTGLVGKYDVLDEGSNLSDHLPIMMKISVPISTSILKPKPSPPAASLKWDKLPKAEISAYTSRLSTNVAVLNSLRRPARPTSCSAGCVCTDETCRYFIQQDYDDLISCIKNADVALPRHKPGVKKDWWTNELSRLKSQSIEIHKLWVAEGKPKQGPTHMEYLRVRSAYKRAIRTAQSGPKLDA